MLDDLSRIKHGVIPVKPFNYAWRILFRYLYQE
jgi:hypothetical protein